MIEVRYAGAVVGRRASLLPAGITAVDGQFTLAATNVPEAAKLLAEVKPGEENTEEIIEVTLHEGVDIAAPVGTPVRAKWLQVSGDPTMWRGCARAAGSNPCARRG
jgi:hypothetical protein